MFCIQALLVLYLRFWNQILIWVSVKFNVNAKLVLSSLDKYLEKSMCSISFKWICDFFWVWQSQLLDVHISLEISQWKYIIDFNFYLVVTIFQRFFINRFKYVYKKVYQNWKYFLIFEEFLPHQIFAWLN